MRRLHANTTPLPVRDVRIVGFWYPGVSGTKLLQTPKDGQNWFSSLLIMSENRGRNIFGFVGHIVSHSSAIVA